jgi:hypothetical protein
MRRRNWHGQESNTKWDGLCVGLFLYVCRHWRMAGFYKDDDQHVIVLLQGLGWGWDMLSSLFCHPEGTSTRAVYARGVSA